MEEPKTCKEHPERTAAAFCVKCGAPVCVECIVEVRDRPHCAVCGSLARAGTRPKGGLRAPDFGVVAGAIQSRFVGPLGNKELRRAAALLIDLACVFVLAMPVSFVFRIVGMSMLLPEVAGFGYFFSTYVGLMLVGPVYFVVTTWRGGRGLGKRLVGLRVQRYGGGRLSLAASVWRLVGALTAVIWALVGWWLCSWMFRVVDLASERLTVPYILFFKGCGVAALLIFSTGVLISFIGRHKRGFHDILASSVVISE